MERETQSRKAERFLELHHAPELLVLPNIWDPLGARLLEGLGYPAVATASAAVAYSLGFADGETIRFETMLGVIRRIASSVTVPLTADIERGYASSPGDVADNIRRVIEAGAVGINIEDSLVEGGLLREIDDQCARIGAARKAAREAGVPIVINARIDTFIRAGSETKHERIDETIHRAMAYLDAGADCIYPITAGDVETLEPIVKKTGAPVNVYLTKGTSSMRELEDLGVSRISLGPNVLRASFTAVRKVAQCLLEYDSSDLFTEDVVTSREIESYVSHEKETT